MTEAPEGMKPCYVREARGDGFGVITAPAALHAELRQTTLNYLTEWALTYLWHCGHHPEELKALGPSLHEALAKWWDSKNAFADPSERPREFSAQKDWHVFWSPSTATIAPEDEEPGKA